MPGRDRSSDRGRDRSADPLPPPMSGTGVTRYVVATLLLAVLSLVLAVRNADRVDVDLLAWEGRAPVYAIAFVAALIGAAVSAGVSAIWRHRRAMLNRERYRVATGERARHQPVQGRVDQRTDRPPAS